MTHSFLFLTGKGTAVPSVTAGFAAAFAALGHAAEVFDLEDCADRDPSALAAVVAKVRPGCVFGYGALATTRFATELFERKRIPYVSLFYDAPEFHESIFEAPRLRELTSSRLYAVTASDRAYADVLKQRGFSRVAWLPLATDPDLFVGRYDARFDVPAAFVGSISELPAGLTEKRRTKFAASAALNGFFERAVASDELYRLCEEELRGVPRPTWVQLFRCASEESSLHRRVATVAALGHLGIEVYGNDVWKDCLPCGAVFRGLLDYAKDAPALYATAHVNLNVTHPQLATAVNQRVFDVAAAGGFVLSDGREDMTRFFGDTAVAYRGPADAADQAAYFLKHDAERRELAAAMRGRVLERHTWRHRAEELLVFLKESRII